MRGRQRSPDRQLISAVFNNPTLSRLLNTAPFLAREPDAPLAEPQALRPLPPSDALDAAREIATYRADTRSPVLSMAMTHATSLATRRRGGPCGG